MKKSISICLFVIVLCLLFQISFGQNKDSVNTLPFQHYDFSNKKHGNIMYHDYLKQLSNTIVIINNKIYKLDAEEYKKLQQEKILEIQVVKDEKSQCEVKNVIIIITK